MLLFTPPDMLLRPCTYAEMPKQPWNPMLAGVNPVTSAVTKSQLAEHDEPKARMYGPKSEVWPYGLFTAGHMEKSAGILCLELPTMVNSTTYHK